jgi:G5 domain protein
MKQEKQQVYSIRKLKNAVGSVAIYSLLFGVPAVALGSQLVSVETVKADESQSRIIYENRAPSAELDKYGTNNNAVSKIEEIKTVEGNLRYKVTFADNIDVSKGVTFNTNGNSYYIPERKLNYQNVNVGEVTHTKSNDDVSIKSDRDFNSFDEYFNYLKNLDVNNLSGKIKIQFNETFKKYNKNRYVEFEIKKPGDSAYLGYILYKNKDSKVKEFLDFSKNTTYKINFNNQVLYSKDLTLKNGGNQVSDNSVRYENELGNPKPGQSSSSLINDRPNYFNSLYYFSPNLTKNNYADGFGKPYLNKGTRIKIKINSEVVSHNFKVGDDLILSNSFIDRSSYVPLWNDNSNVVKLSTPNSSNPLSENSKINAKVINVSDKEIEYEIKDDVLIRSTSGTDYSLTTDFSDKFTLKDNFLDKIDKSEYVKKLKDRNVDGFFGNVVTEIKEPGKEYNVISTSNIRATINPNFVFGESSTGTVKVKYLDENNKEIAPTETVALNKPWYESVNIEKKSIENYDFVSSDLPLKDIVGSGERTVTLKYKSRIKEATRDIPFNTVYKENPLRDKGVQTVQTNGVTGVESYKTLNDKEIPNSSVVKKAKVDKVVLVGTKPKVDVENIPYTTRYENDDTLQKENKVIKVKGVNGTKTTTTTYTVNSNNGNVSETVGNPVIKNPVEKVVLVGTKPKVDTEVLNYTTRYEADTTKDKATREVVQHGVNGTRVITTTYTVNPTNGNVSEIVGKPVITNPIEEVIKIGAKTLVKETPIKYTESTIENNELPKGTTRVKVEGKDGKIITTTTYTVNPATGAITENSTEKREDAVNKVIEKGTKVTDIFIPDLTNDLGVNGEAPNQPNEAERIIHVGAKPKVEEIVIPFEREYEDDSTMLPSEERKVRDGVNGKLTRTTNYDVDSQTGKVTEKVTETREEPVNELYKRGTGVTSKIPFETIEKENPNILPSESGKVLVEGEEGILHPDGKTVIKKPVNKVVEKGTGVTTSIPKGDYKIIEDPTLPEGQEVIDNEGEDGILHPDGKTIIKEKGQPVKRIGKPVTSKGDENPPVVNEEKLIVTQYVNENGETIKTLEGQIDTPENYLKDEKGNITYQLDESKQKEEKDGLITYYYKKPVSSNGLENPPVLEVEDLIITQYIDNNGKVVTTIEDKVEKPDKYLKDKDGNITHELDENKPKDENGGVVKYYYKTITTSKGTDLPPVHELPELKVIIVRDETGKEIKSYIESEFNKEDLDKEYDYIKGPEDKGNGITEYIYQTKINKPKDKLEVENINKLTDREKETLKEKVKEVNPDKFITIGEDGLIKLYDKEDKTDIVQTLKISDFIFVKPKQEKVEIVEVPQSSKPKEEPKERELPKTNSASVLTSLISSTIGSLGLAFTKRKKK